MYKKTLQRKKDGSFERWLGVDARGVKQVFRMPAEISQDAAERRCREIEALWQMIESEVVAPDCPRQKLDEPLTAFWDEERLETAKAIAKGKPATMDRRMGETSAAYVKRMLKTQAILESELLPGDQASYTTGIEHLRELIVRTNEHYGKAVGTPGVRDLSATTAQNALASLFIVHGAPLVLKMDNGPAFFAEATRRLFIPWGVIPLFSPAYMPRYNGGILSMMRSFFLPVAHFAFDHARVDAISARVQDFFGHLREQILVPTMQSLFRLGTLWESTTENLQGGDKRQLPRTYLGFLRRLDHQLAHHKVPQKQPVDLLHDSGRCFAAQHRPLAGGS